MVSHKKELERPRFGAGQYIGGGGGEITTRGGFSLLYFYLLEFYRRDGLGRQGFRFLYT